MSRVCEIKWRTHLVPHKHAATICEGELDSQALEWHELSSQHLWQPLIECAVIRCLGCYLHPSVKLIIILKEL